MGGLADAMYLVLVRMLRVVEMLVMMMLACDDRWAEKEE